MEPEAGAVPARSLRDRHKEATRQELRDTALTLFEENGFSKTSVDEIATAAGVSRSTFFRYFPSKEAILAGESRDESAQLFLTLLRARPPHEARMTALEEALVEFSEAQRSDDRRAELQVVQRIIASDTGLSAGRAALMEAWREGVAQILAERGGRTEPDLEDALASAVLSQMLDQMAAEWQSPQPLPPVRQLIRNYFATLRRLIAG